LQTAQLITAFARWHSETGKKEEINIGDIFAETIAEQENTAKEKQVGIVSTQGLELTTYTDKNMIKTLLRNLVGNAIKHTPQGGEVRMGATQNNGKLKITVTDNGQGITPEKVNRIFNPPDSVNWTNIQTGMGIGLYLCKKIIEWEGGEISVESIQEKGSTFYFTIPTHDKKKT
jgi:signal transduction histidine kinase